MKLDSNPTDELLEEIVQHVVDELPLSWRRARLRAEAVETGDDVELAVCIFNGESTAQSVKPPTTIVEAISHLYIESYGNGRGWRTFTASMHVDPLETWSVETCFEYLPTKQHQRGETRPRNRLRNNQRQHHRFAPVPLEHGSSLADLFVQHAARSFDRHLLLEEMIGSDVSWEFDPQRSVIAFSSGVEFAAQCIAAFRPRSGSWRWAWDCEPGDASHSRLTSATRLLELGLDHAIHEFTEPILSLENADPDSLAMIACGVCGADFWFECDAGEQSLYLLGNSNQLAHHADASPQRAAYVFQRLTENFQFDHRPALLAYLNQLGHTVVCDNREVCSYIDHTEQLIATFDNAGVLEEIQWAAG